MSVTMITSCEHRGRLDDATLMSSATTATVRVACERLLLLLLLLMLLWTPVHVDCCWLLNVDVAAVLV